MSVSMTPGTVIGRDFRIVAPLRAGGMGAVFVAEQLSTGAHRALKVLSPELAADPSARERFVLEARVGARIESDHVVEVIAAGIDERTAVPYLVMELLKGEELADAMNRIGPLPLGDVGELIAQLGHALSRAHARGIVHRDLKPENVFLAESRRRDVPFTAKILDFGVAKLVADQKMKATQAVGTPLYMSPEQTDQAARISPASDVWALGLIVFRLLVGREYWRSADGTLGQLMREVLVEPLPSASRRAVEYGVAAALPLGFDAWFARCIARDIAGRFADAGSAADAFVAIVPPDAPVGALSATSPTTNSASRKVAAKPGDSAVDDPAVAATSRRTAGNTSTSPFELHQRADMPPLIGSTAGTSPPGSAVPPTAVRRWLPVAGFAIAAAIVAALVIPRLHGATTGDPHSGANAARSIRAAAGSGVSTGAVSEVPSRCPEQMAFVTAGNMFMGERAGQSEARPAHKVRISSFCLDQYEVTTDAYERCVRSGNCLKAPDDAQYAGITRLEHDRFPPLCNSRKTGRRAHPINCVDWNMADTFCRTAGGRLASGGARLPTEAEWEFAARGSGQRTFPWGDEAPDNKHLNACGTECAKWFRANLHRDSGTLYDADDGFPGTAPVGSFPAGTAQGSIFDLAGNVWEWTSDWYGPYTDQEQVDPHGPAEGTDHVVRGGGFNGTVADWAKPSYRWKTGPGTYNPSIGFRCATEPR